MATSDSLNPATTNGPMQLVAFQWGNNLTEFDEDSRLVPELAESWDFSPDRKTWVFKLRRGVQFHDELPLPRCRSHDRPAADDADELL